MYFIYGPEKYTIEYEINKIKEANSSLNISLFDFSESKDINSFISSIQSHTLFDSKKLYIIENLPFFEKALSKTDLNIASDLLNSLLSNDIDEFVFINSKIELKAKISKNKFTDDFFAKMPDLKIIYSESIKQNELEKIVRNMSKKFNCNIYDDALRLLLLKVNNNLFLLEKELFKLSKENKNITLKMVDVSVEEIVSDDAFGFINSFESTNLSLIWKKYKDKIIENSEITLLIGQLSQALILSNQIYCYKQCNKSIDYLAKDLNINPYRIKKISFLLNKLGILKVKKMILSLAALDKGIKEGKVDAKHGFERFLIKFFY
ncbi:DNA polymerase III subunit delta [Mycoplasmopsis felifaucium]|uniref:DNA polymerase III subunit delta n=1 Tax=Mycoplasmopsis felifaucium TaxID=35768 RepID=A0ABZ2RVL7_9BACT